MENVAETRDKVVKQPALRMLIGLPLSGKTTFRRHMFRDPGHIFISSDDYIEAMCKVHDVSYNYGFSIFIDAAQKACFSAAYHWVSHGNTIVWDQTNLTEKSRKQKLVVFQDKSNWQYKKIAYYFTPPDHEILMKRQERRKEKIIPEKVLLDMRKQLHIPGLNEGFEQIIHVSGMSGSIIFDSEKPLFSLKKTEKKPSEESQKESRKERLRKDLISHYQYLYEESHSAGRKLEIRTEFIRQLYLLQDDKPYVTDALIEEVDNILGVKL